MGRATANASPEPVGKGETITVTLTRADGVRRKYTGVASGLAGPQFRSSARGGSIVCATVKSVRARSTVALTTTVKAPVDGYWRWTFCGDTTGSATSSGDCVDAC
nr:hypothetical protein OG461_14575 [Streptomyces sp. NBC_00995]